MQKPQHIFYQQVTSRIELKLQLGDQEMQEINKFILLKHKYIDTAKSTVSAYQYVKEKSGFYMKV